MPDLLALALLWIAWCTLHSALISLSTTEFLRSRFPSAFRYYRLLFNALALITLIPVLTYAFSLSTPVLFAWPGLWKIFQILLLLAALLFFLAGSRRYDLKQFLGLRQLKESKTCSVLTDDCSLDTSGILSLVRHPWYSGGLLVIWARPLDAAALVTNLALTGYFLIGAILEERKLKVQFGQVYTEYQEKVSMFFPVKWLLGLGKGRE